MKRILEEQWRKTFEVMEKMLKQMFPIEANVKIMFKNGVFWIRVKPVEKKGVKPIKAKIPERKTIADKDKK